MEAHGETDMKLSRAKHLASAIADLAEANSYLSSGDPEAQRFVTLVEVLRDAIDAAQACHDAEWKART